jgi:hypothetical protein
MSRHAQLWLSSIAVAALMRTIRTLSAVLCASYLLSSAYATVLTFDNVDPNNPPSNGQRIPFDYGDRVNALGVDSGGRRNFDLTHGATPNVAVRMFTANYNTWNQSDNLFVVDTGHANLTYVAWHTKSRGARFIFTADSQYYVRLHSFQMGGWSGTDRILPFLQVLVDGNAVFTQTNIWISGTTANTFSFDPNVVKGGVIEIRFGNNWTVAIDNIGFSQELIPEPASITLLVGGLAGLALRRRTRK